MIDDHSPWTPIVDASEAGAVHETVDVIRRELSHAAIVELCGSSLTSGTAGVALFHAAIFDAFHDPCDKSKSQSCLRHAVAGHRALLDTPGLFAGEVGVAWSGVQLGMADDYAELLDRVDERLLARLNQRPWQMDYDLIRGLVGYGIYGFSRLSAPSGTRIVRAVCERLIEIARHDDDGVTWWTSPQLLQEDARRSHPEGHFNLGAAHGVPGPIAFLARAIAADLAPEDAKRRLARAIDWLFAQQNPKGSGSRFPSIISLPPDGVTKVSGVRWCHGDLGLAAAVYAAAARLREPAWAEQALAVARGAGARSFESSGVVDAGICHGAAGVCHIFNCFYQATGEDTFLHAARTWLSRTLAFRERGHGLGSFKASRGDAEGVPRTTQWLPGLLEGVAGIGLVLLAAVTTTATRWDEMFLLDMRQRAE
jgi:lantibiotic biosynthesis protein